MSIPDPQSLTYHIRGSPDVVSQHFEADAIPPCAVKTLSELQHNGTSQAAAGPSALAEKEVDGRSAWSSDFEYVDAPSPSSTHAATPVAIAEIDDKGRPWWKGVVAYQVWPMSFKDSNGDGIGDLQGIISKLDYLKDLGIDMIWMSPTYKSPLDDWGYDISDYEDMHEQFGSLKDIELLVTEVHSRGMRIILDLVITHTSDQHAWFKESAKSRDNPKADWYMWADKRPGNKINGQLVEEPSNWRAAFGGSAWTYVPTRDQYYIHLFLESQPDLNWHNEEMREAVYQSAIKFWIDRGVDGFRLDTANRFCKDPAYPDVEVSVPGKWQPGSQHYMNGPEMHKWLKGVRSKMDRDSGGKDLMIVGELPLTSYEEVLKYVHPSEKELSMVFDFDMVKLGNNDNPDEYAKHEVSNFMDKDESYTLPKFKDALMKVQSLITDVGAWGTVFMENHDQPRSIARYATPEHKYWRQAGKLLALLQTTLSGTEFIFQGQEIGMLNMPENWGVSEFRDPDAKIYVDDYCANFRDTDPNARENAIRGVFKVGRDNSRTPVQWSSEPNAGFTGSNPTWMKVNDNFSWLNVEAQKADPDSIWHFWKARIAMRKKYRELFMFGTTAEYDRENENTFTYTKMAEDGQTALVILNFSNEELPLNTPQRHLLGHTYKMIACNVAEPKEKLQAWEGRVYIVREGLKTKEGAAGNIGHVQDQKVVSDAFARAERLHPCYDSFE
ncbi:Putative glycosyl hydrolase, family 13, catalytic domain, glycosyl hydrolase, all-beta [Septoria linicola]|uniref:Glycosyl hydrolase, family 13, catalytic domain, glycosyl hydrolase, all-beta n=1 Tax=Septoria linicola TaxID=215465 RepID=A0A9Q9AXF5_9PEZI|nr:Putative glycosyl hydrolase, family 13, catalytic domain, glycosyl hydrolase, all-beta [Septoria linicola]